VPFNVAEVAPAAPFLVEAMPPLLILCGLLIALGLAVLIHYFCSAILNSLAGVFSFVPYVGGITAGVIRGLEQALSNALGQGISKIEGAIGHQWHNLARIAHHWWNVTVRMAQVAWEEAKLLEGLVSGATLTHLLRDLRNAIHNVRVAATLALHRIARLEHEFTRSVAQGVYPRLRTLEHKVEKTLPREIRSARDLAREAEDGVARLWEWTRNLANNPAITAAVAVAIAALGLVGIDLLKCAESGNVASKRGCSVWSALDDLLGLVALGIIAGEFETLVHEAQDLTDEAVTVFDDVFGLTR
jgi:hypothetical protein